MHFYLIINNLVWVFYGVNLLLNIQFPFKSFFILSDKSVELVE